MKVCEGRREGEIAEAVVKRRGDLGTSPGGLDVASCDSKGAHTVFLPAESLSRLSGVGPEHNPRASRPLRSPVAACNVKSFTAHRTGDCAEQARSVPVRGVGHASFARRAKLSIEESASDPVRSGARERRSRRPAPGAPSAACAFLRFCPRVPCPPIGLRSGGSHFTALLEGSG